jgi:hypothetical protein
MIFSCFQLWLPEDCIIVDGNLGVSSKYSAFGCQYQWVNLNHVTIFLHKAIKQMFNEENQLTFLFFNAEILGCIKQVINIQTLLQVHMHFEDLLRMRMGHVLNAHASLWTVNYHWHASLSVQSHT